MTDTAPVRDPFTQTGLELMQGFAASPGSVGIAAFLGMAIESVEDGRVVFTLPTRSEFAIAVNAGFTAPMLGKMLVSTTYRLSSS